MRRKKLVLRVAAACGFILLGLFYFCPEGEPRIPLSVGFKGYRDSAREHRAVVAVTNNTVARLRCQGTVGARRGVLEIESSFDFWLPPKGVGELGVTCPRGDGPAQLCCIFTSPGYRRPAWVGRAAGLLAPLHIQLYYASPTPAAFPKVRFGSKPPPGPPLGLSSYPQTAYLTVP